MREVYEVDLIGEVVALASTAITPTIQMAEFASLASGVHYMYGRDEEIVDRLCLLSKTEEALNKYPLIWLVTPFESQHIEATEEFEVTFPKIYFINGTAADMIAEERYEKNFKPILLPIVDQFLFNLRDYSHGRYKPFNTSQLSYGEIIHDYWGRAKVQALATASGNTLLDFLDCVELTNLKVKFSAKNC